MTNGEKFKEVFGFIPEPEFDCGCAPRKVCNEQKKVHNRNTANMCFDCPFNDWWNKEYKPCFKMKGEFGE